MRLTYSITSDPTDTVGQRLIVQLTAASQVISSPYEREPELRGNEEDGIDFGVVVYPHDSPPEALLPPLFLLDPLDDPETAEKEYDEYGGYRFFGQILLPSDGLGEQVFVTLTREAKSIWDQRLPTSPKQQRAIVQRKRDLALLYQLSRLDAPDGPVRLTSIERGLVHGIRSDLRQPTAGLRQAALAKLMPFEAAKLPVRTIFPCLNDEDGNVRQLAVALLGRAGSRLPCQHLSRILYLANLPARLDAIALLGKAGGAFSASTLNLVLLEQTHTWLVLAALQAIRDINWSTLDELDYVDVIGVVYRISRRETTPLIREAAMSVIEALGGYTEVERALGDHLAWFKRGVRHTRNAPIGDDTPREQIEEEREETHHGNDHDTH